MGWPGSIGVGVLTAVATMLAAGWVADRAVGWYRVSSFEGGAGYLVVGIALTGLVVGLIVGLLAARHVAGRPNPGFVRALGLGVG